MDNLRWASVLKAMPVAGGPEKTIIEIIRQGTWGVTSRGIMFLRVEQGFDAIDVYRLPDGRVTRVGRLPFRVTRRNGLARIAFSPDGRWALANEVTREESDLLLIENFR
jgi:hypothetical protein